MQLEYYVSSSQPDYIGWVKRTLKQKKNLKQDIKQQQQVLTRITNRNEYRSTWNTNKNEADRLKLRSNTFALAAPVWCVSFFLLNWINIYADILFVDD